MLENSGLLGPNEIGDERFSELLESSAVRKVVVGRDPINRLVSAYHSRVATWKRELYDPPWNLDWIRIRQRILAHRFGAPALPWEMALTEKVEWEELVQYVLTTPSGALDRHLVPQAWFACADFVTYDLVGTVEDLPNFLRNFCQLVDREPLDVDGVRLNRSPSNPENPVVVSDLQERLLKQRYRADYQFLGIGD
jgi:hypothetical protein